LAKLHIFKLSGCPYIVSASVAIHRVNITVVSANLTALTSLDLTVFTNK